MIGPGDALAVFGTDQPAMTGRRVQRGNLSFTLEAESIRHISWHGVEVVRGIAWPIRDENWGTLPQEEVRLAEQEEGGDFSVSLAFSVGSALDCRLKIQASDDGRLSAEISMTARQDFDTNRAGFTILHPVSGVSGSALELRHSDGSIEQTNYPKLVRPDQPAMDIVGMSHNIGGVSVDLSFEGEIFEMEDQRNWTDGSYKTYCRPLVYPFTYRIAAGETITQSVALAVSGEARVAGSGSGGDQLEMSATDRRFPALAVVLEPEWFGQDDENVMLKMAGVRQLQVRMGTNPASAYLSSITKLANDLNAEIDVEIIIPSGQDVDAETLRLAEVLADAGLKPQHVMALPEAYLESHQPSGPWPDGATPHDAALAARTAFHASKIGGGVLTNFTEFNRCRPRPEDIDYITHGTTAIVHASDDRSVVETLEALPQVFASAAALSAGKPYRLGLVSIGMRSNPYGADVIPNPEGIRCTMARNDPRHRGLFGAAWAVGALAAAAEAGIGGLSLGAPAGPFSLFAEGEVSRPLPIYHVVRFAAALGGQKVCEVSGLPDEVRGFGTAGAGEASISLSNLSENSVDVKLPGGKGSYRVLDVSSMTEAANAADWLTRSQADTSDTITLSPFSVAFMQVEA